MSEKQQVRGNGKMSRYDNKARVLSVDGLTFSYNGAPVLDSVGMTLERGDFLAVIGPNGGGKTTLLKLILGSLKPDRGVIRVLGEVPARASRRIGYVPQETSINREFPVSVLDVTRMGRIGAVNGRGEADADVLRDVLEMVDMWAYRDRWIGELSGGQRQRVFIARALAVRPEMLILDEPTANVDVEGQSAINAMLKELNRMMTVIVASHDLTSLLGSASVYAYVNRTLHTHAAPDLTPELLGEMAGTTLERICPVEIISRLLSG